MSQQPPRPTPCSKCGSLSCGPVRCRFEDPSHPRPAFDEPACRNHPDRAALDPVAFRRCAECRQYALDGYVYAMIKRDKERWYTSDEWDTDTTGAPLRGRGSREAKHNASRQDGSDGENEA